MARLLIVEDDGALRSDIADKLGDWGHEVFQASDGVLGLKMIKDVRPDLALCDICMPSESGFNLAKRIRENTFEYAHMAIIFMSSLSEPRAMAYGAHCGGDDYIVKPVDYELLHLKITLHLQKKYGLVARFANLIVNQTEPRAVTSLERRSQLNLPRPFGRRKTD